jgi:hypothetical protein
MQPQTAAYFHLVNNPLKLRLFLLRQLPAAFFSGLRIVTATEPVCAIAVPFRWTTQNPFRSTYFACLAMAAELSTGTLAMAQVWRSKPGISMLVTSMESRFYKKAKSTTVFTCNDGMQIKAAVDAARNTGAVQTIRVRSEGRNRAGELVAEFWFEWSFKQKAA